MVGAYINISNDDTLKTIIGHFGVTLGDQTIQLPFVCKTEAITTTSVLYVHDNQDDK